MALRKATKDFSPYPQWTIDRLSDFLEFLELNCKAENALFRGQAADWPLCPKLGRLLPPQGRSLRMIEEEMLGHFGRAVVAYLPSPPTSKWELAALAQHHGMATRLLDWTLNPLAALWFALDSSVTPGSPNAVVWMFCPDVADVIDANDSAPTNTSAIRYWKPRHISPRIRAQGSVFTVHPFDEKSGNFQPLQSATEHYSKLMKILVPRSAFVGIRFQLDRCGINSAVVYPDIDGLARHIEWLYVAGYTIGEEGKNIEPKDPATRQEQVFPNGGKRGGYQVESV